MMTSKLQHLVKVFALAIAWTTAGAFAQGSPSVERDTGLIGEINYGIVCASGEIAEIPAQNTILGYIETRDGSHEIAVTTHVIPAYPGVSFGVSATNISGNNLSPVTFSTEHPKFSGHSSTEDSYTSDFTDGDVYFDYFSFDFLYELQTGKWEFSAHHLGRPLYRVEFIVVPHQEAPDLVNVCPGPPLIG